MNELNNTNYDISFSNGVITFKNINTTIGFVRYNEEAEVEYIFVNPMFRRQGLAKKLLIIAEKKLKSNLRLKAQSVHWAKNFLKLVNKRLIKILRHRVTERPKKKNNNYKLIVFKSKNIKKFCS